ncbi:Lipopolysaccharide assembly protein LapB [hydrothermal vent metagenome]|uniref:Lipopolysaccharide assembly protein LapB n=1 Tax=hydrothermal vent metagenome TaxID=652676 RepID=A0A3B1AT79_9ZZZZ
MDLLLLLLPVAAASGWLAAKRSDRRQDASPPEANQSPAYFKGLNYLLNEQPDKAIDVFVQMLEVDSETVETHLALGNLFRRRGEVERAIRVHQNLIARPTLNRDQRAQALLELGQDYMRAGLFDRAENLFSELIEINQYPEQALQNLRVIYQQEKDWKKCLEVASKLESITDEALYAESAHYYCELAQIARSSKDYSSAASMLKKAQSCNRNCVRATMVQGATEVERGNYKAAIKIFKRVERQDHTFVPEVLPSLIECYQQLNNRSGLVTYLWQLFKRQKSIAVALALVELIKEDDGEQAAADFIAEYLREYPNLDGVHKLIALNQSSAEAGESETLSILYTQISLILEERPAYKCKQCGLAVKMLHWHCPGCKSWDSIKPVLGLEVSSTPSTTKPSEYSDRDWRNLM